MVDLIDLSVVGVVCLAFAIAISFAFPLTRAILNLTLAIIAAVFFCYFVLLKRSRFRTLGYRAGGVRIVGLDGQTPRWTSLTFRLMFALLGPLNWLFDLIWSSGDEHKQAMRDKFASTYVVKFNAQPAGAARVICRYYNAVGYTLMFREIESPRVNS
jgi:uncharacterized RDD family membrane protein YckC